MASRQQGADKMRITSVRHIDGPNVYTYKPVLVARIDLENQTEMETVDFPGFSEQLLQTLPGLRDHHCALGHPGGFVERLYGGTYFGHVVEHVSIELATLCGFDIHHGKTVSAGSAGVYDMVIECQAYDCQKYLLAQALALVEDLLRGERQSGGLQFELTTIRDRCAHIFARSGLGPSTQAIVDEAILKGIPVRRLNSGSLLQLGWGYRRRFMEATVSDHTSAVSVDIACDKQLTKQLLRDAGVPVPNGEVAYDEDDAVRAFEHLDGAVVVKPLDGNQGRGVTLNCRTEAEVRLAVRTAMEHAGRVIVEQYIPGRNVRCLVVGGRLIAASERLPAMVFGDGVATIRSLIDQVNSDPLRGMGHEKPLTQIVVDSVVQQTLDKQGYCLDDVPAKDVRVLLRESANLSTGGQAIDVTNETTAGVQLIAERAARTIGLDVCGIDVMIPEEVGFAHEACFVIEVNAAPGIRMHHHPSFGASRPVARAILDTLFASNGNGRIPILSVTGTNGKTTTTRLIAHVLHEATAKTIGMTTTSGVWIGGQQIATGDLTGPHSARMVLSDPTVEIAVLETARGGILRGGLAYDKAAVAVLTNITPDHLGQDGVDTLEDLMHVKALVGECVEEHGSVIVNADDPNLLRMTSRFGAKVVYFADSESNPVVQRHLAVGGTAFYADGSWLMEARGNLVWRICQIAEIPITMGGTAQFQVENCLAAAAALRAMGCTRSEITRGLTSFQSLLHNPGRCMVFRLPTGGHVVLDYGHNPDGFRRVGQWLSKLPHRRLKGVIGVPGDRTDSVVRQSAAEAAKVFDDLLVKEDIDKRGRESGEIARLMHQEICLVTPDKPAQIIVSEVEAIRQAIATSERGDIVVVFYEVLNRAVEVVQSLGAVPVVMPFPAVGQPVAVPL